MVVHATHKESVMTQPSQETHAGAQYIFESQARISECLDPLVNPDEPFALLDWPNHTNTGDSAIWVGNIAYLKKRAPGRMRYVTRHEDDPDSLEALHPTGPIFLHGGGNFGDIYPKIHDRRLETLRRFRNRPIVQFPQSISFSGEAQMDETRRAIGQHPNFVLLVRDQESFEIGQKFLDCDVRMCPDMAFFIGPLAPTATADASLFSLIREDVEQDLDEEIIRKLKTFGAVEDWKAPDGIKTRKGLPYSASRRHPLLSRLFLKRAMGVFDRKSEARLNTGISQLSRGRMVATDRLHGHILATLLGKRHCVFDNTYGKIARYRAAWPGDDLAVAPQTDAELEAFLEDVARS